MEDGELMGLLGIAGYTQAGHADLGRNGVYILHPEDHVLKLYGSARAWTREVACLRYLAEKPFAVPELIGCGVDHGRPWARMRRLQGVMVDALLPSLPPAEAGLLYRDIGALHGAFANACPMSAHGHWTDHGRIQTPEGGFYAHTTAENRRAAARVIEMRPEHGGLFRKGLARLASLEPSIKTVGQYALCHRDFKPRNLLAENKGGTWTLCGLIDFEASFSGDPEFDVAISLFDIYGTQAQRSYLEGYASKRALSQSFGDKLPYYLLAFCFDILGWAHKTAPAFDRRALSMLAQLSG